MSPFSSFCAPRWIGVVTQIAMQPPPLLIMSAIESRCDTI
jgi:hypothetical protein